MASPRVMSMGAVLAGSHFETTAPISPSNRPPFFPEKTASSTPRCFSLAFASMYKRAVPLPPKKLPGHSAASAALQPLTSSPSTAPCLISNTSAPEHQPWSGSVSGPSQHGHNALQLQNSIMFADMFQAICVPPSSSLTTESANARAFLSFEDR